MIWHQLIRKILNIVGEAKNSVLLEAESSLGDITDCITLNKTSMNVSDQVAGCLCHKETEPQ